MKTMSWSRYHCLSWSVLRAARQHRVAKRHSIRHRRDASSNAPAMAGLWGDDSSSLRSNRFRSVMRMFRTEARPGDTDN